MRKFLFTLIAAILLLSCNSEKFNVHNELKSELHKIIQEVGISGINLVIVMPDDNIIAVPAGYSDKEKQIFMKPTNGVSRRGIVCTTTDLARWGKMYYGGKVFFAKCIENDENSL